MRLAISNIAWSEEKDELIYAMLKDLRVDALEVAPSRLFKDNPYDDLFLAHKYAKHLKETYNISIVSIQSMWFGLEKNLFRSKIDLDFLTEYTFKVIDFANAIDCNNIVFGNPKQRDGFKPELEQSVYKFFIRIAEYAKGKGVIIALEPNPKIYGTNFLNTTQETVEFLEKLAHSNLKLNLDLGTMIENNESIEYLIPRVKLINHIHISEPYLGPIRKRELHRELKKLNYSGVVSIEMAKLVSLEELKSIILYIKEVLE